MLIIENRPTVVYELKIFKNVVSKTLTADNSVFGADHVGLYKIKLFR